MTERRNLSVEEQKRLERLERTRKNRRGRRNPAVIPDRLARTAAFAPRRNKLITDSTFHRIYEVPGYSVIEVKGRELGSQHRDALIAVFRLERKKIYFEDVACKDPLRRYRTYYEANTTWRELLIKMGRTQHVNNLLTMLNLFEEILQVSLIIHEGRCLADFDKIKTTRRGLLPDVAGALTSVIDGIEWEGAKLDSRVKVRFGPRVLEMVEQANLVSINADVQFRLKSDYAKSFWPFIDSQPNYTYVGDELLAQLAGLDFAGMTSAQRAQFRKDCRQAFTDMQRAEGLKDWQEEVIGQGRQKTRRYRYTHAVPRQMELLLPSEPGQTPA
ncbi:hypothetical protein [Xanthobacter wiegelii]|uniref:hypothetical protein n=1 Tax=Xanthobacter wiegelii TaxID=3119913 RepID=UPI00372665F3